MWTAIMVEKNRCWEHNQQGPTDVTTRKNWEEELQYL